MNFSPRGIAWAGVSWCSIGCVSHSRAKNNLGEEVGEVQWESDVTKNRRSMSPPRSVSFSQWYAAQMWALPGVTASTDAHFSVVMLSPMITVALKILKIQCPLEGLNFHCHIRPLATVQLPQERPSQETRETFFRLFPSGREKSVFHRRYSGPILVNWSQIKVTYL